MVEIKVGKTSKGRVNGGEYKRPNFSTEFKRHLVEQTFEPGALDELRTAAMKRRRQGAAQE